MTEHELNGRDFSRVKNEMPSRKKPHMNVGVKFVSVIPIFRFW